MSSPAPPPDFTAFYAATYVQVARSVRYLADSWSDAEDLAQDAFARAYARWDSVQLHPEPEAWVKLVAANLGRSKLRRARLAAAKLLPHKGDATSAELEAILDGTDLSRALDQLPPRQQAAIRLHYLHDSSVKDVANALNVTESSIKTNLHRGRIRLLQILNQGDSR